MSGHYSLLLSSTLAGESAAPSALSNTFTTKPQTMKYRVQELEISAEDPFKNDALAREPLVKFLSGLIGRFEGPFVLALDSPWGTGKTTLVRMLQAHLVLQDFQCLYFNAWQVDYAADPLVALVSAIDEIKLLDGAAESAFRSHLKTAKKITTAVAKRGAIAIAKAATLGSLDLEKDMEAVAAEIAGGLASDAVDAFQKEKKSLEKFRQEVGKAVEQLKAAGKKETLIFFIDELDRCRPTFAIEMLERIKHLFDVPNIVFVLSIDKAQLEASTAAVYGERINAPEYLRRFIDLEYGIPVVQTKKFTEALFARYELDAVFKARTGSETRYDRKNFVEVLTALADIFGLSLRARERCITRIAVVMDYTPNDHHLDPVLVAFLVVLRLKNMELFSMLCSGTASPEEAMEFLATRPAGAKFVQDGYGVLIEAYLLASDSNEARKSARYRALEAMAEDANANPAEKSRAGKVIRMHADVGGGFGGDFPLKQVAEKIDLAAAVRD